MKRSIDVSPCLRIDGELSVPGDKSISHRALLVAALGEGRSSIRGLSPAADVGSTIAAIRALGVTVEPEDGLYSDNPPLQAEGFEASISPLKSQILVDSPGVLGFVDPSAPIDVGNSGTTIRLLLGVLAGSGATGTLTGDASIRRRPMGRVVDPLRAMGAAIEGVEGGRFAPLTVRGTPLRGIEHQLPLASAQVKSALLLAGLSATGETIVVEPAASRDHTERMLAYVGAPIEMSENRLIVKSTKIQGASFDVPGDLSSAAFLLVAASIRQGSRIVIRNVGVNPTRAGILEVLERFGAEVTVGDRRAVCNEPIGTVTVRARDRRPLRVGGALTVRCLDELPLVAVLGAMAEGETVVTDASELRVKESDRIEAIEGVLGAMGAEVRPTPEGFVVRGPARLRGATVSALGDHRIAMMAAVAALAADGPTRIEGWETVPVSYPGFERDLERLAVR